MLTYSATWLLLAVPALGGHVIDKRSAITDCLTSSKVNQALPGSAAFTQGVKPFNLRLPFTPVALAQPSTVAEVQAAVACAAKVGVTISPKSGGHSYASHGLGGEDGHLCIDMRSFNNVTVDSTTGIAAIGPGERLGNVATKLYAQGKRAISHGTCPGVGVGGLTLHGGYGFSSHTHGLTLDNLVSAQVVLANSSIVTASNTENPDLFYALRGAGASFGVVTQFNFQTFPAPEGNVVFSLGLSWSQSSAKTGIAALQDYAQNTMPAELNLRVFINSFAATLSGVYYGSQANFNTAIKPLLSGIGVSGINGQSKGWLDTLTSNSNGALAQPFNYDTHETFFSKSLMTQPLSTAAIGALVDYWFTTAKSTSRDWYLILDCHGGKYSAISQVADNATSYAHRGAIFKMEFYDRVNYGSYPANGFTFLNGWVDAITKAQNQGQLGMYINYADTSLDAPTAHKAYWLGHYDRLSQIKTAYDPNRLFSNPQAINSDQKNKKF